MKRQHLNLSGVLPAVTTGLPGTLPAFAQGAQEIKVPKRGTDQYNAGVPEQNVGY